MTSHSHTVQSEEQGVRIDKLLTALNTEASRSQVQMWIKDNYVKVNGEAVKSNHKCQQGEEVTWVIPEPEELEVTPENIPIEIIYEDRDVLVVNKPRGMVVHPSPGHSNGTLVNAILYHCNNLSGINGVIRPGIVHRIDMDTSGLLMVAKNDYSHESLVEQLKDKTVKRSYKAIVHGNIPHEYGTIDAPLGRDPNDRQKMAVVDSGKHAVTHFEVVKRIGDFTLVKCVLETGRTHQIRVHMQYIGFPLVGDPKYGPRKTLEFNGQALHAEVLGFSHPKTNEWLEFQVDPPEDFKHLLEKLEKMY